MEVDAGAAPTAVADAMEDVKPAAVLDEEPSSAETIFINNLNERVKPKVLKQTLANLFKTYGKVLSVTAHSNLRMRGQAFVALESPEQAAKAVKEVTGFPLYGKPMQLAFAKTPSDSVIKRKRPDELEAHTADRLQRKKASRRDNPVRRKLYGKKVAIRRAAGDETGAAGVPASTASTRRIVQMPSEYLPPHKILFVQNLPDEADKAALEALFRPFPNFVEVRMVPGRKGIAFVEYTDDASSTVARDKLHNIKYGGLEDGPRVKVTFAKA